MNLVPSPHANITSSPAFGSTNDGDALIGDTGGHVLPAIQTKSTVNPLA